MTVHSAAEQTPEETMSQSAVAESGEHEMPPTRLTGRKVRRRKMDRRYLDDVLPEAEFEEFMIFVRSGGD